MIQKFALFAVYLFPLAAYHPSQTVRSILPEWHHMPVKRIVLQIAIKRFIAAFYPFFAIRQVPCAAIGVSIQK